MTAPFPNDHVTIAVVSAGLSQPSSTRLRADQLAAATDRALRLNGAPPGVLGRAPR